MQNTLKIAWRQFRSYFDGPAAYIVAFIVLAFAGAMFWYFFFLAERASVRQLFTFFGFAMTFGAPAVTMGLLAEERRSGTIELLVTMPVRELDVILGKYLGALGLVTVILVVSVIHPLVVSTMGDLAWGPVLTGYFGLFLMSAAMLAIGVMASSFTDNQLVAFFISCPFLVTFTILTNVFSQFLSGSVGTFVQAVSFDGHLESMARGVIDSRDLIFFLSVTIFALMVAFRALERRRWS